MAEKRVTLRDVAAAAACRAPPRVSCSATPRGISISEPTRQRVRRDRAAISATCRTRSRGRCARGRRGSSSSAVDSGYDGNYARTFTRGLDAELAAHDHVLLVRHGHAAPGSQQRLLEAIAPRAVLRMPDYLATRSRVRRRRLGRRARREQPGAAAATWRPRPLPHRRRAAGRRPPLGRFGCGSPRGGGQARAARAAAAIVPRDRGRRAPARSAAFLAAHAGVTAVAAFDDDVACASWPPRGPRPAPSPATWPSSASTTPRTARCSRPRSPRAHRRRGPRPPDAPGSSWASTATGSPPRPREVIVRESA